jgi:hypothetical protein
VSDVKPYSTYVVRLGSSLVEHFSCHTLEEIAARYRPGLPGLELVQRDETNWTMRVGERIAGSVERTG